MADHETHAIAFVILIGGSSKLAKHREELRHVFFTDSFASVVDVDAEKLVGVIVSHVNVNVAFWSKLDPILRQVGQDLL